MRMLSEFDQLEMLFYDWVLRDIVTWREAPAVAIKRWRVSPRMLGMPLSPPGVRWSRAGLPDIGLPIFC
jgi:hypothetical protein